MRLSITILRGLCAAAVVGLATPAFAQELQQVHIHGFGGAAYGKTNRNHLGVGSEEGDYRHSMFSLNLTSMLSERFAIVAQTQWEDGEEGPENFLDYAFADLRLSKAANFRFGQVKQPFGLYAEVMDVGTLRPFLDLPRSVYGPMGGVGEAYRGAGFSGNRALGRWGIAYDVYGGALAIRENEAGIELLTDSTAEVEDRVEQTPNLVGGRFSLRLPMNGLSVGVSGFSGTGSEEEEEVAGQGAEAAAGSRRSTVGAHLELERERFLLRSEMMRHTERSDDVPVTTLGGYAEASFQVAQAWQLAARWDRLYTTLDGVDVSAAPSLLQHTDVAAGVNVWLAPNMVLKGSYHVVRGNRFAGPHGDELATTIADGALNPRTNLVSLGVNFSF